jgi:hypothetical protein
MIFIINFNYINFLITVWNWKNEKKIITSKKIRILKQCQNLYKILEFIIPKLWINLL